MARGGFPGGFGGGNMNNLMKQAQAIQKKMQDMQKEVEDAEFEASTGGGAVSVKVSGKKEVLKVSIKPDSDFDISDMEMVEEMIQVAINDALNQVDKMTEKKMGKYANAMPGLF